MPSIKKSNNSDKLVLTVTPRTVFGKKLNRLRKEGNVPANIYGPEFKSQAVTVITKDFLKTYKTSKATGVVYLALDKQELPVLIKNVQRHPVDDFILHADFRKIDLKQKIQTAVPIKVIGQSEAVTQKGGVLLTQAETLLVEALPTDIPKEIEVDISTLKETGQEIKVADLKKTALYEIKDVATKIILSVVAHKEESVTPETAPTVAPEVLTAKPEEGEVAAEGEAVGTETGKPTAGKTSEAKPPSAKATGGRPPQPGKPAEGKK